MKVTPLPTIVLVIFTLVWASMAGYATPAYGQSNPVSFTTSALEGTSIDSGPTSLQFGPDGRLYVSERLGTIYVYTVERNGPNDYVVIDTEEIDLVKDIPNHDDDGTLNTDEDERQVTGLLVAGTQQSPVLYVTSSDPRIGAGAGGLDLNLDTNSGIISRLTLVNGEWNKVDLVRGLPRSEENHATNGMALDTATNTLYVTSGGSTNAGSPSNKFAFATEYALSAAILSVDLDAINALPILGDNGNQYIYDLPTVNDPERADDESGNDINDPFGGNDGLNQAKIVPGGPVQIYSPGYRNPYDLVLTEAGQLFTVDNGANGGWGGFPEDESANCTNDYFEGEPGSSGTTDDGRKPVNNLDNLHLVEEGFYGGHATPIRGNPQGAGLYTHDGNNGVWRTSTSGDNPLPADWPPVPVADARQCDFINPGQGDKALQTFLESTNGITEYTTDNFDGALQGDLLTASFDGIIWHLDLGDEPITNDGSSTVPKNQLAANLSFPLDVVAQGENQPFEGTVWITAYGSKDIKIMEPADYGGSNPIVCTGDYDINSDDDNDGYSNADEIDNGNNPCSASDLPADNDGDFLSDLNDDDDDDDGLSDQDDPFAIDSNNGSDLTTPVDYPFFNEDPGVGMWGVGFTGLMSNGETDYHALYPDATNNVVAGGTAGLFTVVQVDSGDAMGATNTQKFAFQFGVNVDSATQPFDTRVRVAGPFFDSAPTGNQTQGMYIGTGDQDNYLKVVVHANDGNEGIQVLYESAGEVRHQTIYPHNLAEVTVLDLFITVDPATGQAQPKMSISNQAAILLGEPLTIDGSLLNTIQSSDEAMAVGVIASSGNGPSFTATWDEAEISHEIFAINQAPTIAPLPDQFVVEEDTLSLKFTATDPDAASTDQTVSVSLSNEPNGMTVADNGDGTWTLTWIPTNADIGVHEIQISATDSAGGQTTATLTVNVVKNNPPQLQIEGEVTGQQTTVGAVEDEALSLQITASDPDAGSTGQTVSVSLSNQPGGMAITNNGDGTWALNWTPTEADIGRHEVQVNAADSLGTQTTATLIVNVVTSNNSPLLQIEGEVTGQQSAIQLTENESKTTQIVASDPDNDSVTLSASGLPQYASFTNNGDGTGTLTFNPTFVDAGETTITITATDARGAAETMSILLKVADVNHPPTAVPSNPGDSTAPVQAEMGETVSIPVIFTDADQDVLTLAFKTGELPEGLSLTDNGDGTGMIIWDTSGIVASDTTYSFVVVATDAKGDSTERTITVELSNRKIYLPYFR